MKVKFMIEKKFVDEGVRRVKTRQFIERELEKAGVVDVAIQRTTLATRIGITSEKPGLIIGRKGKNIQDLAEVIQNTLGVENPQIEVVDVQNSDLEPAIIARFVGGMLKRGLKPKKVLHRALERVMSAGAIGCEIILQGKLQGKGAKGRKERIVGGYIKKAGDPTKFIKKAHEAAIMKQGIIGIKVHIVPPNVVFPDKIDISKINLSALQPATEQTGTTETAGPAGAKTAPQSGETVKAKPKKRVRKPAAKKTRGEEQKPEQAESKPVEDKPVEKEQAK